ncbi:hypothetical protein GJ699_02390 [Duganella sp. FT80W]|uniref:Uncharacterized protein n=1 Tax=Duganella guangzhouensis TaxID=2666084 RepID=A0A6I2KXT8_9BURK|nr:hypothetical protein [Duganella guangzhouensis]MRW88829.1 hypothetical protein [Duganella guangzhouensis]
MTDSKLNAKVKALTIRMPMTLHTELKNIAESKGWTLNDEINFRLRAFNLHEQMRTVATDVDDIKAMLRRAEAEK